MDDKHTREIRGFPGYTVSDDGRVFSASDWRGYGTRELIRDLNASGYPSVRLTVGKKRTRMAVHKLVALAFLGAKPSPSHEVRHLDGDKTNNHVSNLAWGTAAENAADRELHGRTSRGLRHTIAIVDGQERAGHNVTRGRALINLATTGEEP